MNPRNRTLWLLVLLSCLVLPEWNQAQSRPEADLIITNAKVWTVDKSLPMAQAVAVLGDRIVAVGSSTDIDTWHGPHTHLIDAGGKRCCPASTTLMFILCPVGSNWIASSSTTHRVRRNSLAALATAPRLRRKANGFLEATGTRLNGTRRTYRQEISSTPLLPIHPCL